MREVAQELIDYLDRHGVDSCLNLVEIIGGVIPIRRAFRAGGTNPVFQGETYWADAGGHTEFNQDTEGKRQGLTITLQNLANAETGESGPFWSQAFPVLDLNGAEVRLIIVPLELIDVPNAYIEEKFWVVSGYEVANKMLSLRAASPLDLFVYDIPRVPVVSPTCGWRYKEGPCNSVSDKPDCPYTLTGCVGRFPAGAPLPIGPSWPLFQKNTRKRA